jgi:hypothetical protein
VDGFTHECPADFCKIRTSSTQGAALKSIADRQAALIGLINMDRTAHGEAPMVNECATLVSVAVARRRSDRHTSNTTQLKCVTDDLLAMNAQGYGFDPTNLGSEWKHLTPTQLNPSQTEPTAGKRKRSERDGPARNGHSSQVILYRFWAFHSAANLRAHVKVSCAPWHLF